VMPLSRVELFCFPPAGGSTAIFAGWPRALATAGIRFRLVMLPGRLGRLADPPVLAMDDAVRCLVKELAPSLHRPFAFFGYSMGALIAFELARSLKGSQDEEPVHLFVAAASAPDMFRVPEQYHKLPDAKFIERVRNIGGLPQAIADDGTLMRLALPGLRADFSLLEHYVYREAEPLGCDISAFGAAHDEIVRVSELEGWKRHTCSGFSMRVFPGGHFFLLGASRLVICDIIERLTPVDVPHS
jgi:surfactin synthase thioesterase subunit